MTKTLLVLPPIISIVHVLIALVMYYFGVQYQGNILLFATIPVVFVIAMHVVIIFMDKSMGVTERVGYGLVHIPFCLVFSMSSLLILTLEQEGVEKVKSTLIQCEGKSTIECVNTFYQSDNASAWFGLINTGHFNSSLKY